MSRTTRHSSCSYLPPGRNSNTSPSTTPIPTSRSLPGLTRAPQTRLRYSQIAGPSTRARTSTNHTHRPALRYHKYKSKRARGSLASRRGRNVPWIVFVNTSVWPTVTCASGTARSRERAWSGWWKGLWVVEGDALISRPLLRAVSAAISLSPEDIYVVMVLLLVVDGQAVLSRSRPQRRARAG